MAMGVRVKINYPYEITMKFRAYIALFCYIITLTKRQMKMFCLGKFYTPLVIATVL